MFLISGEPGHLHDERPRMRRGGENRNPEREREKYNIGKEVCVRSATSSATHFPPFFVDTFSRYTFSFLRGGSFYTPKPSLFACPRSGVSTSLAHSDYSRSPGQKAGGEKEFRGLKQVSV